MVFQNDGIEDLQATGIRNVTGETPTNLFFAGSDNTFTGSELTSDLQNEWIRKLVTWSKTGINSKYTVQLTSTEAIGSNIAALGLTGGSDLGSDTLFTSNRSFIGTKTSSFNVQAEGEIIITRPSV